MARIMAATFQDGGGHSVAVAGYCLDRTDAKVDAYARCVDAGACDEPDRGGDCNWAVAGRGAHPINCVDHAQAAAYCA